MLDAHAIDRRHGKLHRLPRRADTVRRLVLLDVPFRELFTNIVYRWFGDQRVRQQTRSHSHTTDRNNERLEYRCRHFINTLTAARMKRYLYRAQAFRIYG